MRRLLLLWIILLVAAPAWAQESPFDPIPMTPEQEQRARQMAALCLQAPTPDECVVYLYYHTLRSWGGNLARWARTLAGILAIIDLILLGYSYVLGHARRVEGIITKLLWRLLIFAAVFWLLQSWPALYDVPGRIVRAMARPLSPTAGPTGGEMLSSMLEFDDVNNGVIVQTGLLMQSGTRFFLSTLKRVAATEVLFNQSLLFAPFIGFVVMIVFLVVCAFIIATTIEAYIGLTIGAVMMGLATFKGTRMISASVFSTIARAVIQLFVLLLMSLLLLSVADLAIYLIMHYQDPEVTRIAGTHAAARSDGFDVLAVAAALVLIGGIMTLYVPHRVAGSLTRFVNWNIREIFDDDRGA